MIKEDEIIEDEITEDHHGTKEHEARIQKYIKEYAPMVREIAMKNNELPKPETEVLICECGKPFYKRKSNHIFCAAECPVRKNNRRERRRIIREKKRNG